MLRRHHVPRTRVMAVLAVAGAAMLSACSGDVLDGSGRLTAGLPASSSPTASASSSGSPSASSSGSSSASSGAAATAAPAAPSAGSGSPSEAVSPALALLRKLRAATAATWQPITDPRTGTRFALPDKVAAEERFKSGITQRVYANDFTKQSGISVGYIKTPSPAAAAALVSMYPDQLASSFRNLGADDAAITERSATSIAGLPAVSFRFTFTPTTVPQIRPVWLVSAVASGANIALLQTILFPPDNAYDFARLGKLAQARLVASFRTG